MERILFKSDTLGPVAVWSTPDGKIDFRTLDALLRLEPNSIKLGGVRFPERDLESDASWTQIKNSLGVVGTREDPVVVSGRPIPEVPRGIDSFVAKADPVNRLHGPVSAEMHSVYANEVTVRHYYWIVLDRVGRLVLGNKFAVRPKVKPSSSSLRNQMNPSKRAQALTSDKVSCWDLVLSLDKRRFLVVEMKRPSLVRTGVDVECPDLIDALRGFSETSRNEALAGTVFQFYTYMVNMSLGYGIISSFDLSYFVRRLGDSSDTIEISKAKPSGSNKFLGVLGYVLSLAARDNRVFEEPDQEEKHPGVIIKEPGEGSSQSQDPRDDLYPGKGKANDLGLHPMNTWSRSRYDGLRETPAEHLHLEAYLFATGWSGRIVRGTYEGHPVVVKLAPFASVRAEALLTEIIAYHKLKKYWGKYVPKLVSYGTTAGGKVVYIATDLINGFEIGIVASTPEAMKATFDALNAVHESGILYGDIRCNNMLVVKRGRGGVRLIDFGFSRPISSSED